MTNEIVFPPAVGWNGVLIGIENLLVSDAMFDDILMTFPEVLARFLWKYFVVRKAPRRPALALKNL